MYCVVSKFRCLLHLSIPSKSGKITLRPEVGMIFGGSWHLKSGLRVSENSRKQVEEGGTPVERVLSNRYTLPTVAKKCHNIFVCSRKGQLHFAF